MMFNAEEYSHLLSAEEEASRRNYWRIIGKMAFEEEPCRTRDEDTEDQAGWCFPSFSLLKKTDIYQ